MKALPLEQRQLVEMQRLDLAIARLEHQERTHPALQTLAALQERATDLKNAIIAAQAEADGLDRQISQVEEDAERVKARRALQQSRLDEGKVPMRDMSAMEHEISSMDTRIGVLEERAMEVMEQAEKMRAGIQAAQQNADAIQVKEERFKEELGEALSMTGQELSGLRAKRAQLAESLPQQVVRVYEQLQQRLGPRVVIEMLDGNLIDAPVELPLTEIAELATYPVDQLYESDETEYLVARTTA